MKKDWADKIVDEIVHDLSDRRGLRQEWAQIDPAQRGNIKHVWAGIIRKGIPDRIASYTPQVDEQQNRLEQFLTFLRGMMSGKNWKAGSTKDIGYIPTDAGTVELKETGRQTVFIEIEKPK